MNFINFCSVFFISWVYILSLFPGFTLLFLFLTRGAKLRKHSVSMCLPHYEFKIKLPTNHLNRLPRVLICSVSSLFNSNFSFNFFTLSLFKVQDLRTSGLSFITHTIRDLASSVAKRSKQWKNVPTGLHEASVISLAKYMTHTQHSAEIRAATTIII